MTRITLTHTCIECGRTFDMWDSDDAIEWANGHDCEAPPRDTPADVLRRYGIATATDTHGTRIKGTGRDTENNAT